MGCSSPVAELTNHRWYSRHWSAFLGSRTISPVTVVPATTNLVPHLAHFCQFPAFNVTGSRSKTSASVGSSRCSACGWQTFRHNPQSIHKPAAKVSAKRLSPGSSNLRARDREVAREAWAGCNSCAQTHRDSTAPRGEPSHRAAR